MDPQCPFQLREDLESVNDKILDVGSGPYSRLGFCIDEKKLDITLLDPLACVYRMIGTKYGVNFPIQAQTGMVELLHVLYPRDKFDFVHMSNALDHSFSPLIGLKELLFVTRIGGKVVLRHSDNEAENENYKGFHQWNLTVDGGKFIIWNKDKKIIVNEYLNEIADIECVQRAEETLLDDTWIYNKVIIRKKKEINIEDLYSSNLVIDIIEALVSQNAKLSMRV